MQRFDVFVWADKQEKFFSGRDKEMEKEEIAEAVSLEHRISEMKTQFQQSYDVFIRAHEELSKISFDSSKFAAGDSLGGLSNLEANDVKEIVEAGSIDQCISTLRSKIRI